MALVGLLIMPSALLVPLQFSVQSSTWFWILKVPQAVLTASAFAMVGPVLQAVVPYRLRGMGTAMSTLYIFFIGGFMGGLVSGFLTDAIGIRGTVIILGVPSAIIGGLLLMNGARFIRNDLSLVVEELLEEKDEHEKRNVAKTAVPVLQLANIDFSYGPVQVLFGVDFEVQKGETVALLGTNGAGKSTALRVVSGLAVPERGVVRLNGQNITYVSPEQRAKFLGIMQLPGGHGVFGNLTVDQNLAVSARLNADGRTQVQQRIANVYDLFPELAGSRKQVASSMSGGQQQMLALGRGADPRARGADDRRALARSRAAGGAAAHRGGRGAQGPRADHDHRGAVAQRRHRPRRPGDLHGEGPGAVRRLHRRPDGAW